MARRSDHTREEIKSMALNAALMRVKQFGIQDVSTRKVATDIGYTVGTLYQVFEGYEDMMMQVNSFTLEEAFEYIKAKREENTDSAPEAQVRLIAEAYYAFAKENYHAWHALFVHIFADSRSAFPDWYVQRIDSMFAILEAPLREYAGLNEKEAFASARSLWAAIHGICTLGLTGKLSVVGAGNVQESLQHVVNCYLLGLKAHRNQ